MATETRVDSAEPAVLYCATVRTPIAPMHSEPGIASQMISQQLAGHHVDVIDAEGDWVCVTGEDGYNGWMHLGFLARAPQASARQSRQPSRVSLGCVTTTAGGIRRSLPLRALLAPDESVESGEVVEPGLPIVRTGGDDHGPRVDSLPSLDRDAVRLSAALHRHGAARDEQLGAELLRLGQRAGGELASRDSGGKAKIVLDPRAGSRLPTR